MEFRFIDNNTPLDRRSQKLIRSHAMKGKNLGKAILARGYRGRQCESGIFSIQTKAKSEDLPRARNGKLLLPKASKPDSGNAAASPEHMALPRNHFCGAELSYFVTPKPFTSSSQNLFHEFHYTVFQTLYPRIFCRQSKEAEISWFELMIVNPCVFHCGLAMTGAHISRHLGQRNASLDSTRHFIEAMRLLRRELSTNSEPQDSSLAVIVSLAIHANLTNTINESRIHLHGLKNIIELRSGGLAALCAGSPEVGNKIRRADLDLALMSGTPTLFGSQSSPLPTTLHVVPLDGQILNIALPHPLGETSPAWQSVIIDVLALCGYAGRAQLGAFQYQDLIISIFQRLVDYSPLAGPRPPSLLDDVCQLGFLAFMSTVIYHNQHRRPACSALLSKMLWTRLDRFSNDVSSSQANNFSSLCLWLIFFYVMSAPDYGKCRDPSSSVAQRIHALADTLTLKTWEDVNAHLSIYPWIAAFHDAPGRKLWEYVACR